MENNKIYFILMIIIFTLIIIIISNCDYHIDKFDNFDKFDKFDNNTKYMIIAKNNDLIINYKKYKEDLKYYMNIHFDYYVKDTNKPYARFITQLDRNSLYYRDKLIKLNYPFIIRKEQDGYYIDYQLPIRMINNKVADISWDDFNLIPKILVTCYDAPNEFISHISNILKDIDNIEYQYSNSNVDMLYDQFIYTKRVLNDIKQTLKNKKQNNKSLINSQNNIIKGAIPYINAEELKYVNKINSKDISLYTNNSYIEISIETRDFRFIYIYEQNDEDADKEFINLIKYLNDLENLDRLSDYYNRNLRYFRIPINIMRVIIKMGEYLKIF
jgi:hypothetical protein